MKAEQQRFGLFNQKLHPFSRITVLFVLTSLSRLYLDPRLGAPLLILSLILAIRAGIPQRLLKVVAGMIVAGSGYSFFISSLFVSTRYYKVIPPEIAGRVVILSPELPIFGQIGITYGSLIYWVSSLIRGPSTLLFGYVLIHSVSAREFMSALVKIRVPSQVLFGIALMYQYVSVFRDIIGYTINAQKLRGWRVKSNNPFKASFSYIPMSCRIVSRLIETVDKVTIAIRARGFTVFPPRDYSAAMIDLEYRRVDFLVMFSSLLWLLISLYLLTFYNFGMI